MTVNLNLEEILFVLEIYPLELDQAFKDSDGDEERFKVIARELYETHRANIVLPLIAKVLGENDSEDISVPDRTRMVKCIVQEQLLGKEHVLSLMDDDEDKRIRFAMFESLHPEGVEISLPSSERVTRCKECVLGFGQTNVLEISIIPIQLTEEDNQELKDRLENGENPVDLFMEIIGKHQDTRPEFRDITPGKGSKKKKKSGGLTDMFDVRPSEN